MRKYALLLSLLLLLLLPACGEDEGDTDDDAPTALAVQTALPTPPTDSCRLSAAADMPYLAPSSEVAGQTLDCGTLDLPQDPSNPAGPRHQLAYVILLSRAAIPESDPVIFLAGGPGTSAILSSADWIDSPLRDQRDIILVDQRGTGYSTPALDCDRYGIDDADDAACSAAITAAGADLAQYHTGNHAADIAALMEILAQQRGYTAYNLYGVSYGTRLALAIMRDHPALLRAVILDSPYPPQASTPVELAANTQRALDSLAAACAADPACNEAYPDLAEDFFTIADFLNEVPINGTYFGRDFVADVFAAQADAGFLPAVPAAIDAMVEQAFDLAFDLLYTGPEDYDPLAELVAIYAGVNETDLATFFAFAETAAESQGTFLVFECQEENFFNTLAEAETFTANAGVTPLIAEARLADSAAIFEQCEAWFAAGAPAIEDLPVSSDIPTLILSGALDPITPPNWATDTAATLSNSNVINFPLATHAVYAAGDCPRNIADAFINSPNTPSDTTCISEMTLEFEIYTIQ